MNSKAKGKMITIPSIELPTSVDTILKDVDAGGRLLTGPERDLLGANLRHYSIDTDGRVWVTRPPEFPTSFRFTERPDLASA